MPSSPMPMMVSQRSAMSPLPAPAPPRGEDMSHAAGTLRATSGLRRPCQRVHGRGRQRRAAAAPAQRQEGHAARAGGELGLGLGGADEADRKAEDGGRARPALVQQFEQVEERRRRVADGDDARPRSGRARARPRRPSASCRGARPAPARPARPACRARRCRPAAGVHHARDRLAVAEHGRAGGQRRRAQPQTRSSDQASRAVISGMPQA